MKAPDIKTTKNVVPMIYAYTTPGIIYHDGYIKIGYTEQDVNIRIYQQTHTAGIMAKKEWQGTAIYDDGTGEAFHDYDFHGYLRANGIEQPQDKGNSFFDPKDRNEWFYTTPAESKGLFVDFKSNRGIHDESDALLNSSIIPYTLRKEQAAAVAKTVAYRYAHDGGEFLWNCKPRFGKSLCMYDFCKQIKAEKILIVTNRPAIANSWYADYAKFIGRETGYFFVSQVSELADKKKCPLVMTYKEYADDHKKRKDDPNMKKMGLIDFVSLQDLKGSIYFGGIYNKLQEIKQTEWDVLVIDEAHEGVDTYKTDVAFDQIKRHFTLHLSGTPFKAMASSKFPSDAIFNWTYADEQQAKRDWDVNSTEENPYEVLPQINLYTYQMSEIIQEQLKQGIEIQGETEEYAFDLNEFFATNANGRFVYNASVDKFLDALTTQKKFPFSTPELRAELKHTFWLLNRVDSARALAKKLKEHPVFKDYEIILAAGDGKVDDDDENAKSFDKVTQAIASHEKTITISVGQLTTGVTIPEWTAVLMLSNIASPSLYMQAAFRAQNPCMFQIGTTCLRKENAYVFDFDPARTLDIYEQFSNDLSASTAGGHGDLETRKKNIKTFLNFFPVIGEDENGELVELDAEKVLTIPRKIRSMEVVRRGFMSNFLFQNIAQVFGAPQELMDIINKLQPMQEQKVKEVKLPQEVKDDLSLDENGNVSLSDEYIIGKSAEIFGQKIEDVSARIEETVAAVDTAPDKQKSSVDTLKDVVHEITKHNIVAEVQAKYGEDIRPSDAKRIEARINDKADLMLDKEMANHAIEQKVIEQHRTEEMQKRHETGRTTEEIDAEFDAKMKESNDQFQDALKTAISGLFEQAKQDTVKTVETTIKERQKSTIEDGIRDHLRGFSRTIPSFLMAYGDDTVTLATFDTKVPGKVFYEVTSITIDEFKALRDGKWTDPETGEVKTYSSGLFDEVVFDDSIKEFLNLKRKLANYFDEKSVEDIFDYIPPQKTFQIFTPKNIVQKMVDQLEKENPGCFDDPDHTFIDLYMKSGLYPAEIVKRLYRSPKMQELFPNGDDRLKHIFKKQVYGLAPTEIIYNIVLSYVLGFDEDVEIKKHNFRLADALPYAKEGKLQELLDKLYGDEEDA